MKNDLQKRIDFIMEVEKLKNIYRQTYLLYEDRKENDAEHSWHLAMMAVLLSDYADEKVDLVRVIKMVLVHDIVEIDAGDTYCYDEEGALTKQKREEEAAERIFGLLPSDVGEELKSLWMEFDLAESPDARFGAALDRLQPVLLNIAKDGKSWQEHGINYKQVYKRNSPISKGSKILWDYVEKLLLICVEKGFLLP